MKDTKSTNQEKCICGHSSSFHDQFEKQCQGEDWDNDKGFYINCKCKKFNSSTQSELLGFIKDNIYNWVLSSDDDWETYDEKLERDVRKFQEGTDSIPSRPLCPVCKISMDFKLDLGGWFCPNKDKPISSIFSKDTETAPEIIKKVVETREYSVIERTEIELIEDVWDMCKAHNWDSGELWDRDIAPHKIGTLVKIKVMLYPEHKIISCEEVTDKMINDAFESKEAQDGS